MPILLISITIIVSVILLLKVRSQSPRDKHNRPTQSENLILDDPDEFNLEEVKSLTEEKNKEEPDFKGKYQRKYLLSKNEWYEYKKLKQLAETKGLQVCPKVRLLDLIEPRRGDPKYKTWFYKIQAKHVDFVICDQNLYVKTIIELDDNSHNQPDRRERDDFVDTILRDVGYHVVRTHSITEWTLSAIETQNQPNNAYRATDRTR